MQEATCIFACFLHGATKDSWRQLLLWFHLNWNQKNAIQSVWGNQTNRECFLMKINCSDGWARVESVSCSSCNAGLDFLCAQTHPHTHTYTHAFTCSLTHKKWLAISGDNPWTMIALPGKIKPLTLPFVLILNIHLTFTAADFQHVPDSLSSKSAHNLRTLLGGWIAWWNWEHAEREFESQQAWCSK